MPSPEQTLAPATERTASGRWRMLAVLLVCAAPVIASYLTFYVVRPESRRNFGVLVSPQRPLPNLNTVDLAGKPGNLQSLRGQWLLVSIAGGACDEACARHLYLQRQLREGMGREKDRLDWVWLVTDDQPVPQPMRVGLTNATVLRVAPDGLAQWLQPDSGRGLADHLYLVDPQGNWMLRFPAELGLADAAKAKRDLERLLRASASWDQPGR